MIGARARAVIGLAPLGPLGLLGLLGMSACEPPAEPTHDVIPAGHPCPELAFAL